MVVRVPRENASVYGWERGTGSLFKSTCHLTPKKEKGVGSTVPSKGKGG